MFTSAEYLLKDETRAYMGHVIHYLQKNIKYLFANDIDCFIFTKNESTYPIIGVPSLPADIRNYLNETLDKILLQKPNLSAKRILYSDTLYIKTNENTVWWNRKGEQIPLSDVNMSESHVKLQISINGIIINQNSAKLMLRVTQVMINSHAKDCAFLASSSPNWSAESYI